MNVRFARRRGDGDNRDRLLLIRHLNLRLAALGAPVFEGSDDGDLLDVADDLLRRHRQQQRLLEDMPCPPDRRIEQFLGAYFKKHGAQCSARLPRNALTLDKPKLGRELSLPPDSDQFQSQYISSYRVTQGVLHNPVNDRRTTKGVFHIVEGGLPIPGEKKAVPVAVFGALLEAALRPPEGLSMLPFTSSQAQQAHLWVSLYLRPLVVPEVPGLAPEKRMEVRFFAPGGLVSNLDFVERIFGNAGDPFLPENDAGLDVRHWTGTTGCVILAPHLTGLTKRELGLPHVGEATERQRRDGMCWEAEDERYNDGVPFKVVCRDANGVIVTLIADNYFGYSKKEIKSQISYSTNLVGGCEEEHAGGALAFPTFNLGEFFMPDSRFEGKTRRFGDVARDFADLMEIRPEGYGIDKRYPNLVYVPHDVRIELRGQSVSWEHDGQRQSIRLLAGNTYMLPSGYKVQLRKHPHAPTWRLVGIESEGTFCHKPSTVSGGGKSEIAKSIMGAVLSGPLYVRDIKQDLDLVDSIFQRDYSTRFADASETDDRPLLSSARSLGSVIRLLTPSDEDYTSEYNEWLRSIPQHIRALVFIIKRFYRQEWGAKWRRHFTVDIINGHPGHELKYNRRRLVASFLRVGLENDRSWRIFKLRQDYIPSEKVQMEDDISVSTMVPAEQLSHLNPDYPHTSVKLVENCERHLFQRPDDAVIKGADVQTESDLAGSDNFISNFEPLTVQRARTMVEDSVEFSKFSEPMQRFVSKVAGFEHGYFVSSAHPRLVNGRPSPNVRYLQERPDLANPEGRYIAEVGTRLARAVPMSRPVYTPVNAVLTGRRNNPPEPKKGIRPLSVYNPIHYQELPEFFMDAVASLTGKSPSTTGAGSEGALTKGPFNALAATADLNTALVGMILGGYHGFSSAAGFIGPNVRVDHDISLLIPEIWCRIPVPDREPAVLIERGYLEPVTDLEYEGRRVAASRLGYRITARFAHAYMGKVFDNPTAVFDEAILRPESQDLAAFVDGVENIVEAHERVARGYLEDGTVEDACPPLQALLHIMANGSYEGMTVDSPAFRAMFTPAHLLSSDWYQERLDVKQHRDIALWSRHVACLREYVNRNGARVNGSVDLEERLVQAERELARVKSDDYRATLVGGVGADWLHRQPAGSRQAAAMDPMCGQPPLVREMPPARPETEAVGV